MVGDECESVSTFSGDTDVPRIPALICKLANVVEIFVEYLDTFVFAIDDIQVLCRIYCKFMRKVPLAVPGPFVIRPAGAFGHLLNQLSFLRKQEQPVVAVAIGDYDVSVVQNRNSRRKVQMSVIGSLLVGNSKLKKEFVELRAELHNPMGVSFNDVNVSFPVYA